MTRLALAALSSAPIALALALALPHPAAAAPAAPGAVGGIEFMLGFPGSLEADHDNGNSQDGDMATSLGLVPWVEKQLGQSVGLGAEMMFVWVKGDADKAERRLIMSPHLRLRMSFPIVDKITFDGFLAAGATIWTAEDNPVASPPDADDTDVDISKALADTRFGWSLRFGFGGSYAINEVVSAFAHLGWYTTTTFGDDVTANINTVPLCLGLRGNF